MRIDYENEKAIPYSLDGMELSTEINEKNVYFANMDRWLDQLEDRGFKEIEQNIQTNRNGLTI